VGEFSKIDFMGFEVRNDWINNKSYMS
jgi:hypothetical protein